MPRNIVAFVHVRLGEWRKGNGKLFERAEHCTFPRSPGGRSSLHVRTPLRMGVRDIRKAVQRAPALLGEKLECCTTRPSCFKNLLPGK